MPSTENDGLRIKLQSGRLVDRHLRRLPGSASGEPLRTRPVRLLLRRLLSAAESDRVSDHLLCAHHRLMFKFRNWF